MTPERWRRICAVLDRVLDAPVDVRVAALADACREEGVDVADATRFLIDDTCQPEFLSGLDPTMVSRALRSMGAESLPAGTRLGVYEIVGPLGSGGMGEVYRARDTTLRREVALKLLPPAFVKDPDRVSRFTREAQALAAVSHPNIGAIHGLQEGTGAPALVLELVEGPTLAERLALGPVPLAEALPIARQIADALVAAHEQTIVHRDLKPANIKIRPDGLVKVLDFGLAKFLEPDRYAHDSPVSPAVTNPVATRIGAIIGTAAYVAPEQANGSAVDKRADIWAFGCVLYEMLVGRRPLRAESVSDTLALVLGSDPDWSALPAHTPAAVRRLLRRCLVKDPRHRLADIADARLEIEDALAPGDLRTEEANAARNRTQARRVWLTVIAASVVGLFALWAWLRPPVSTPPVIVRFTAPGPPNRPSLPALSRDGSQLAFQRQAPNPGGSLPSRSIYIRRMEELVPRPLAGTDDAMDPAFSPDGQWLAFLTSSSQTRSPQLSDLRQLKKVPVAGGQAQTLVEGVAPGATELTWTEDGWIYFTSLDRLLRVQSAGSVPETLATIDPARREFRFNAPQPLPGGGAVLLSVATNPELTETRVVVLDLTTAERRTLLENAGITRYAPSGPGRERGHLVYGRNGALFAVAFDPIRRELIGSPVRVIDGVRGLDNRNASFGFSSSGTLVYVPDRAPEVTPVWIDRRGNENVLPLLPNQYFAPILAADDERVALLMPRGSDEPQTDLWVYGLSRGTLTRLSFEGDNSGQVWTPDGKQLIHVSETESRPHALVAIAADGSGTPRVLLNPGQRHLPVAMTPDGRTLVVRHDRGSGAALSSAYFTLTLVSDPSKAVAPELLFESRFPMGQLSLSPDGKWAAYESSESGREEIYVVPFPIPDRKWQISTGGGTRPLWSRNGHELFYRDRNALMTVPVETKQAFRSGKPAPLLSGLRQYRPAYDVDRIGNRFLMLKLADTPPSGFHVVVNWFEELRRRAPADDPR
jgi:serine/threonine protein kinase